MGRIITMDLFKDTITYEKIRELVSEALETYKEELNEEREQRKLINRLRMFIWKLIYRKGAKSV